MRPQGVGLGRLFDGIWDGVIVAKAEAACIVLWYPGDTEVFERSMSVGTLCPLRIIASRGRKSC